MKLDDLRKIIAFVIILLFVSVSIIVVTAVENKDVKDTIKQDIIKDKLNILNDEIGHNLNKENNKNTHVDITRSDFSGIDFKVTLGDFQVQEIIAEGEQYQRLILPGSSVIDKVGKAELPTFTFYIAVPQEAEPSLQFNVVDHELYQNYLIYPFQPLTVDSYEDQPFTIDEQFYSTDEFYPQTIVEKSPVMSMRGCQIVTVTLYPFSYNPVSQTLKVYRNIEIHVDYIGGRDEFIPERLRSVYFEPFYTRYLLNSHIIEPAQILNPTSGQSGKSDERAELLIIVGDYDRNNQTTNYYPEIVPLAEWRHKTGIETKIVNRSEICDNWNPDVQATAIRQYIKDAYRNWTVPPSFVLIVGDVDQVGTNYLYTHYSNTSLYTGSDFWYGAFEHTTPFGYCHTDLLPEIHVSRISVDSATELETVVDKILSYSKNPNTDINWFDNILLAAKEEDDKYIPVCQEVYTHLNGLNYNVTRIYWGNATYPGNSQDVIDAIDDGACIVSHRDHGNSENSGASYTGWHRPRFGNDNISSLSNGEMYPVMFSINCLSCWFDSETDQYGANIEGLGETGLRDSEGFVAIIGASRVSPTWLNNDLFLGLYDAIFPGLTSGVPSKNLSGYNVSYDKRFTSDAAFRMGQVLDWGKMYMYNQWSGSGNTTRSECQMYHLFGDPTMEVWTKYPEDLTVDYPSVVPLGRDVTISVSNDSGSLDYALVCLRQCNGDLYERNITINGGIATLNIDTLTLDDVSIVVTAPNHLYFEENNTIQVDYPPNYPSSPSPSNGAIRVLPDINLGWTGGDPGGDPVTYDVYLGTINPPPKVISNQTGTTYNPPGDLNGGATYYWKIVAWDNKSLSSVGPIWSFTTDAPPNIPSNPSPSNGATGVPIDTVCSWTGGDPDGDSVTYDVYFGTSNPPPKVISNQTATTYDPPGDLPFGTKYYWKIIAWDPYGLSTLGPVWDFTVRVNNPPNTPSSPSPSNGATGVLITTTLSWTGGDPDGDDVAYDVYFGTSSPPPKIISNQTATTYNPPGDLNFNTKYYWQIVAWDEYDYSATGSVWNFTTEINHPPNVPSSPQPTDNAIDVDLDQDLSWTGGDPDGDDVTYDVYFGTVNPPSKVVSNQTATTYNPGIMLYNKQYYWQIIAWDEHDYTTKGPIWTFTTIRPTEVWVDDDYDQNTPGWNNIRFDSVQDGIDQVALGGTVYVHDGSYYEYCTISSWPIDLIGNSSTTTILDGSGSGTLLSIVSSDGTNISGLKMQNADYAMDINSSSNCDIFDINASDNNGYGLYLYQCHYCDIYNCVSNNNQQGFRMDECHDNNLWGDIANNNGNIGFNIDNCNNIEFWENDAFENEYYGVSIENCYIVNLYDNIINNNYRDGIGVLSGSNSLDIYDNIINGNDGDGIASYASGPNNIHGNEIKQNNVGIYFDASNDNAVWENTVNENTEYGIHLTFDSISNDIGGLGSNTVSSNGIYGILLSDCSGNFVTGNIIQENQEYDLFVDGDIENSNYYNHNINGNIGSGGDEIFYFYGIFPPPLTGDYSEIFLYNADFADISQCTVSGSTSIKNNGIIMLKTDYTNLVDVDSSANNYGIYIRKSNYNTIVNSTFINNKYDGIYLFGRNNSIAFCQITHNDINGITMPGTWNDCDGNKIYDNHISYNGLIGIEIAGESLWTSPNMIFGNNFINNGYGVFAGLYSGQNQFFHNNFIDNTFSNAQDDGWNTWDNGYPDGGNYWDDYSGVDNNGDGIGDTPYPIPGVGMMQDTYPYMDMNGWEAKWSFDVTTITSDPRCIGVEFDGTNFWVTGADNLGIAFLYEINPTGYLLNTYLQPVGSWGTLGWRDLAWDGEYLYAGDDGAKPNYITQIDPNSGMPTGIYYGPFTINPCEAVAYDSTTDSFWTATGTSSIYQCYRDNTITSYTNPGLTIHGMAMDESDPEQPMLWIWSQGANGCLASEWDPQTGSLTGKSFDGDSVIAGTAAGFCAFNTTNGIRFCGMHDTISDTFAGYELIIPENNPPVLDPIPDPQIAYVGVPYYYDVNATDPDNDTLYYEMKYGPQSLQYIDHDTGEISFTPSSSLKGTYEINITVTDGEFTDYQIVTYIITDYTPEVIIDNTDPEFFILSGNWPTLTDANAYGGNARYNNPGTGAERAGWRVDQLVGYGTYDVYVYMFQHNYMHLMATNAPYDIHHKNGITSVTVNQSQPYTGWVYLGNYTFDDSSTQGIVLSDAANGYVVADAVKLTYPKNNITLYPTDDTFVDYIQPTDINGNSPYLIVRTVSSWELTTLMNFDLDDISPGTTIESAKLYLYYNSYNGNNPSGRTLNLHQITQAWDEGTTNYNNRPTWNSTSFNTCTVPGSVDEWMECDVTTEVQDIVDGLVTNHGWQIMDHGSGNTMIYFRSKEHSGGDYSPYLEIEMS